MEIFLNKKITIIFNKAKPIKKSETLLKKYLSIQFDNQFNPLMYPILSSTTKLGLAPAFDHSSNQTLTSMIFSLAIDHERFPKHV